METKSQTFKAPQQLADAEYQRKFPNKKAPAQSDFLRNRLQGQKGPKYFDSGDYALQKFNKKKDATIVVGQAIPTPEAIPQRKPSCSRKSNLVEGQEPAAHPHDEREPCSCESSPEKTVREEQHGGH